MKTISNLTTALVCTVSLLCFNTTINANDTLTPPTLSQQTKGTPAVINDTEDKTAVVSNDTETSTEQSPSFTAKEHKRSNGQTYRLEFKHANSPSQSIDETGSDGRLESTDNDIEDTPNLPKWTLGSW